MSIFLGQSRIHSSFRVLAYFVPNNFLRILFFKCGNVTVSFSSKIGLRCQINRGVEITSKVADSDQAIILDQVENGLAIRMAIIYLLGSQLKI